jgi:hypothetical protein
MFNRAIYEKYDRKSKELLLSILESKGYKLKGSLDTEYYKMTDIIVEDVNTGEEVMWEIEAKNPEQFNNVLTGRYKDIIINTRKATNQSKYYCIFSQNFDQMFVVEFKDIKASPIREIYTQGGYEDVFTVDRKHLVYYNIKHTETGPVLTEKRRLK